MTPSRRGLVALGMAVTLVGVVAFAASTRHGRMVRVFAPGWFGMEAAAPGLWVEEGMPADRRADLERAIPAARRMLAAVWGPPLSEPRVLACASAACFRRFGGRGGRGQELASRLLLSPTGLDSTFVAHEWNHAELRAHARPRLPSWFDEGLAVVVSRDLRHSNAAYDSAVSAGAPIPSLDELDRLDRFLAAPNAYLVAAHEVRRWLDAVGRPGLGRLCARLRQGDPFEVAWRGVQERHTVPASNTGE